MRFSVFWLALVVIAGPGLFSKAAAQAVGDASVSECEQARRDWAANSPPMPPQSDSDRLAYLNRHSQTKGLRFDLDCDHRLSFEEFFPMAWEGWRWMDADTDGVVTRAEYVTHWCTRRLRGLDAGERAVCERASASNYRDVAGYGRSRVDQQGYRFAAHVLFRRADKNRDGYLTRSPNSVQFAE